MANSNSNMTVKFRCGLTASDPDTQPVLFIGQGPHLAALSWDDVKCKFEPRVTEEAWRRGVSCAMNSPGEAVEMRARSAGVGVLCARRSRHAAPARPHVIAKLLRSPSHYHCIALVCRKRDVLASAVAVARSFPLYSARTASSPLATGPVTSAVTSPAAPGAPRNISVEIVLVKEDKADGESEDEGIGQLHPALTDNGLSPDELCAVQSVCDYTRLAASLADMPCNVCNVDTFIEAACKVANELDIPAPTVIRGEELKARGMGGLYGVGRGATVPPALVVLSHTPPGATHSVAWVGKGIVYDTGGLSIKARTSMVGMKGDCAGAAAVLGAFAAAVRARTQLNLHAVLCLAENAVGPNSTRPDDIHQLYSGRTVEINNTDAEGRLVLSDGVVYAQRDLKADTIVDVATLTGAQGTATGKYHSAVVSNSSRLESLCVRAGLRAGEPAHALPFAPELHFSEFCSAVADMKNSVADRNNAQPSCAGLFILSHLGFDFPGRWLHVDMAAPATAGERHTGYGVALLTVLFGAHTENTLLRALAPGPVTH